MVEPERHGDDAQERAPLDAAALTGRGVTGLLGVVVREAGPERVVLELAVTPEVHQPFGVLHGGVSALLAESAASIGGSLSVAPSERAMGIELNASHLRAMRSGTLIATATPVRKGRTVHVWDIDLVDQDARPICRARCTLAIVGAQRD
jgi:1,4-dihydroxy-2-naphthoyl-CoA hydrolase